MHALLLAVRSLTLYLFLSLWCLVSDYYYCCCLEYFFQWNIAGYNNSLTDVVLQNLFIFLPPFSLTAVL